MRWNIVIGIATGVCALVQLAVTAVGYFNPDGVSAGYGDMLFTAVALVAVLLSYPLLRGYNWARLSLIVLLSLCAVGVALLVPFLFIANHWIYTRLSISLSGLFTVCVIVSFIVALLHADVRRDFGGSHSIV
jgi:glucose-6-phosphate-specific signal transduction histidine kinase